MQRFLRLAIPLALLVGFPLVYRTLAASDPLIPDHEHWTVPQCTKYWNARGKTVFVESTAFPSAHAPSTAEADPKVNLVASNAASSPIGDPASGPNVVVVIKAVGETKEVEKRDLKARPQLSQVHRHFGRVDVNLYQSLDGRPEELDGYASWLFDRATLRYQGPWVEGPVYEGGSVGVVINGSVTSLMREHADIIFAAFLAVASAYALERWARAKRTNAN